VPRNSQPGTRNPQPLRRFNPAFARQAARNLGSQAELARLLGISKEAVRCACDGTRGLDPAHIEALAAELGLAPESAWLDVEIPAGPVAGVIRRLTDAAHCSLNAIHKAAHVPLGTLSEIRAGKRAGFSDPEHGRRLREYAATKLAGPRGQTSSWAAREAARRPCRRCAMNLSDDVLAFYKLKDDPWRLDVRTDKDVFPTRDYQRMHKLITRAVQRRDFAVVDGPTGSGKSQMCRHIIRQVARRKSVKLVPVAAPDVRRVSASTLCDALVLNLAPGTKGHIRTEKLAVQVGELLIGHHRQGNTPVVLIDDAHRCPPAMLGMLKKFYEFRDVGGGNPYEPLLAIVLLGWPVLTLTLRNNVSLLEVARRADVCQLRGLAGEHAGYLEKKLKRVGCNGKVLFPKAAVAALRAVPHAQWPLVVNRIASRAMYLAWSERATRPKAKQGTVTAGDIRHAAEEEV